MSAILDDTRTYRTKWGAALKFYWDHVDDDTDECVVWPFSTRADGYGQLWIDGRNQRVHRLACDRHHGPCPPGLIAVHAPIICHNKRCFNGRRHISWSTRKVNSSHLRIDGTLRLGEANPRARLTQVQVDEIRARYAVGGVLQRELAAEYGVAPTTVTMLIGGRTWGDSI